MVLKPAELMAALKSCLPRTQTWQQAGKYLCHYSLHSRLGLEAYSPKVVGNRVWGETGRAGGGCDTSAVMRDSGVAGVFAVFRDCPGWRDRGGGC